MPHLTLAFYIGRVAERFNAAVLKTVEDGSPPGVQIPPLPPKIHESQGEFFGIHSFLQGSREKHQLYIVVQCTELWRTLHNGLWRLLRKRPQADSAACLSFKARLGFKSMLKGHIFCYFPLSGKIWTQLSHHEDKNTAFLRLKAIAQIKNSSSTLAIPI